MGRRLRAIPWEQSADELYDRHRQETDLTRRKRLQVLWLVRDGTTATDAARQAGVGLRSVMRWLDWYRATGLEAVLERVPG